VTDPSQLVRGITAGVSDARSGITRTDRWGLRPATVEVAGDTTVFVIFDGDSLEDTTKSNPIPAISLVGYLGVASRVMILTVPPSGNYVISRVFSGFLSDWIPYTPVLSSSGVSPSIGVGELTGQWRPVGYRLIEVEILTLWGAGSTQGTGTYFWTVPFTATASSVARSVGPAYLRDAAIAERTAISGLFNTGFFYLIASPSGTLGAGVPQTWSDGDIIRFNITYEIEAFS
jgi:hypothetical protein